MSIKFDLVSADINGKMFHGLLADRFDSKCAVIHIHGTGGDFYSNPFVIPTATEYASRNFSFMTVNVPGSKSSAATEDFSEFTEAIDTWIDRFCREKQLIIQGHSLGALKALFYLGNGRGRFSGNVVGLVLLAPFDVVAFYAGVESHYTESRALVAKEFDEDSESMVPKSIFAKWPISSRTYLQLTEDGGVADLFPSRKGMEGALLPRLQVPVHVSIGTSDFASFPSPAAVGDMIAEIANVDVSLVCGAPHNFRNHTGELVDGLANWLDALSKVGRIK